MASFLFLMRDDGRLWRGKVPITEMEYQTVLHHLTGAYEGETA
jgi:hypothetical protein